VATEISTTKAAIKSLGDEIAAADTKIKKADEGYNSLTQELKENEAAAESFEQ
jgi:chromosome segregation ATPase